MLYDGRSDIIERQIALSNASETPPGVRDAQEGSLGVQTRPGAALRSKIRALIEHDLLWIQTQGLPSEQSLMKCDDISIILRECRLRALPVMDMDNLDIDDIKQAMMQATRLVQHADFAPKLQAEPAAPRRAAASSKRSNPKPRASTPGATRRKPKVHSTQAEKEGQMWNIKRITGKRMQDKQLHYEVMWEQDDEVTWEPASRLWADAPDAVSEFETTQCTQAKHHTDTALHRSKGKRNRMKNKSERIRKRRKKMNKKLVVKRKRERKIVGKRKRKGSG